MTKRLITKEIRARIYDEIERSGNGEVTVDFVSELLRKVLVYDPQLVEEQWYRDKARRLLAQRRDESGVRIMFATQETDQGVYINIETCKDLRKVRAVKAQLEDKYAGIAASIAKAKRRVEELEGQTSLFRPQAESSWTAHLP